MFSPFSAFMRKGKHLDPYLWLTDPGSPKLCESCGFGSPTLQFTVDMFWQYQACDDLFSSVVDPWHFGSDPDPQKTVEIKVFLTNFARWWKDPDPYLWLTDQNADPGGPKTYESGFTTRLFRQLCETNSYLEMAVTLTIRMTGVCRKTEKTFWCVGQFNTSVYLHPWGFASRKIDQNILDLLLWTITSLRHLWDMNVYERYEYNPLWGQ
jgi:hypothetical protein